MPPKVPTILFERRRDRGTWGWLTGSVVAHGLVIFALVFDWSGPPTLPDMRAPGGEGPLGGGGGGGAEHITYVQLPAWDPPAKPEEEQPVPERPEDVVLPPPTLVEVRLETPRFEIPPLRVTDQGATVLGRGPGTGGGPGAGTGSGGGVGTGQGTGIGSHTGPGSGGDGGEIFPPATRFAAIPFGDAMPKSVRGKTYSLLFVVTADGLVEKVDIVPQIRDVEARRKLVAMLMEWRFAPAITREGVPVRAEVVVSITL